MKKTLKNSKKLVMEIAQKLISNQHLLQLLLDDTPDLSRKIPEEEKTIEYLLNNQYISVYPIVKSGMDNVERNSFLVILLDEVNFRDEGSNIFLTVFVSTDADHILLENGRNRMLEICDLVCDLLDGQKMSNAGELNITSITSSIVSNFRSAYSISVQTTDQSSERAEI